VLENWEDHDVDVDGTRIHATVTGDGPPVLLLHGYPQTHVMWHRVAPGLVDRHTVVLADLRGYGDSSRPASTADHASYSKRAMAADQVGLMHELGFDTFSVVGHDRGARVAHRLCLDHPGAVSRVALLDIVPTRHVFTHVDRALAEAYGSSCPRRPISPSTSSAPTPTTSCAGSWTSGREVAGPRPSHPRPSRSTSAASGTRR
jgi:haloacetate dehalogenase